MKTFTEDQISKAVYDFPQGCTDQKEKFLRSLGINTVVKVTGVGAFLGWGSRSVPEHLSSGAFTIKDKYPQFTITKKNNPWWEISGSIKDFEALGKPDSIVSLTSTTAIISFKVPRST